MIKVENGMCHIKTSKGIPGLTTDLAVIAMVAMGKVMTLLKNPPL